MVRSIEGKHPEYYEAVLQLRDVPEEAVSFVKKQIKQEKIYVAKVKTAGNGYDFYLADNQFTRALGKKLQQKFNGLLLVTASLVGRKKDKDIHRFTVLFRGRTFSKEDLIEYHGEEYRVKGIGREIMLKNDLTGKKVNVKWKNSRDIKSIRKNSFSQVIKGGD